jgi:signal transduction histidine kinase
MKPGKLYIKIFLSFVLVLVITEVLIFALFVFFAGRSFHSRVERYVTAQSSIVREYIEEKIRSEPEVGPAHNRELKKLIFDLGAIYRARVWLTGPNGNILIKSFDGDIPEDISRFRKRHAKDSGHIKPYHHIRKGLVYYIYVPVDFRKGEVGGVHILFEKTETARPEGVFALGLVGIGIVIALLIIPVSRRITEPVKQLKASALRIAEGDLGHRALVKSRDEIGELGRSFNHMADRVEKMIRGSRELTTNISHELRSPLARIRIAEELIRERWENGDYKDLGRHLDDIREDIEELDQLIGSILLLSKLDIHEEPLKHEALNLSDLINELVGRLEPVIKQKDLRIMTFIKYDYPVTGNKDSLKTAFSNVLDNAVKFTAEKGKVIIKMYPENEFLKISITNSFEKLTGENLIRIFDPFFRTEQSPAAGSGLGLAITKKIIERHGGTIKALNSEEGLQIAVGLPMTA